MLLLGFMEDIVLGFTVTGRMLLRPACWRVFVLGENFSILKRDSFIGSGYVWWPDLVINMPLSLQSSVCLFLNLGAPWFYSC